MAKFVMKKGSFYISNNPTQTPVDVTAAVKGATTALTIVNSLAVGDVVVVSNSGWRSLDGKPGVVLASPAPTATAVSVAIDTSGETAALSVDAQATFLTSADWTECCLQGLDIEAGTSDSISVGTFCDDGAQLAGSTANGNVAITGFVDVTDSGYNELLKADDDGLPRSFRMNLPKAANPSSADADGGQYYFINATVGGISQSFQTGAAATFSGTLVLANKPAFVA